MSTKESDDVPEHIKKARDASWEKHRQEILEKYGFADGEEDDDAG